MKYSIVGEKLMALERENREYEERISLLNESQQRMNLAGITKLKNKITRLKGINCHLQLTILDTLNDQNNRVSELESELFTANQVIEGKDRELAMMASQTQEMQTGVENQFRAVTEACEEKIKKLKDKVCIHESMINFHRTLRRLTN